MKLDREAISYARASEQVGWPEAPGQLPPVLNSSWSSRYQFTPVWARVIIIFFFFKFIYLFWEKACVCVRERGKGRERKRENPKQAPCCQHRAWCWSPSMNHEIMTWAESKSWILNQLSHPGTPILSFSMRGIMWKRLGSTATKLIEVQIWLYHIILQKPSEMTPHCLPSKV